MSMFPICSGTNFPRPHMGQGGLSQKMSSLSAKMAEGRYGLRRGSSHYFRKKSKLAVGGSGGRWSNTNFFLGLRDLKPECIYG